MFVSVDFDQLKTNEQHYQIVSFQVFSTGSSVSLGSPNPEKQECSSLYVGRGNEIN